MDDEVLLADGGEAVAGVIANAFGVTRVVRHEFEIGPIQARELRQLVERQHAVDEKDLIVGARESALHESTQLDRHCGFEL